MFLRGIICRCPSGNCTLGRCLSAICPATNISNALPNYLQRDYVSSNTLLILVQPDTYNEGSLKQSILLFVALNVVRCAIW